MCARIPAKAFLRGGLILALLSPPALAADVAGQVTLDLEGVRLAELGPTVVYLEPVGGARPSNEASKATIRQHNARFEPDFLVVAAGDRISMPNDDTIFHNVFSFSRPNDFDLGVYPAGEARTVTFQHPGLVRIYCSIHESMSAVVLVAPTRHYARVSSAGAFTIEDVPAGRYRLVSFNERLPEASREIEVGEAGRVVVDLVHGAGAVAKRAP